ncbi:MAG: hypothetical protein EBU97_06780, partial [Rhodobacteraceae bacterium]|nr:hypothetical protein [Paracoccaceae bacterium]
MVRDPTHAATEARADRPRDRPVPARSDPPARRVRRRHERERELLALQHHARAGRWSRHLSADGGADPGLGGQRDYVPRGKVLGGSSSINAMVYIRGHAEDYEEWKAAGNPGWGWDDVLPAYRAIEDTEAGPSPWRGTGGPLFVSANRRGLHPLVQNYIAACEQAGLPYNPDFNGETQEGAGTYQLTVKNARRNSAARAFLRPAMRRPNCRVITHAMVTRVIIEQGRAVGVEYSRHGQTHILRAKAEVILAAGAINSPQLLHLSGIGPGAHLQGLGLPVAYDNPNVGAHYSDHHGLNYTFKMRVPT